MRFWEIDAVRGIAICMMVAYHTVSNLYYFGSGTVWQLSVDLSQWGWVLLQKTTALIFLLTVGVSLSIASKHKPYRKIAERGFVILCWGMVITIVTGILLSNGTIWFGILHLIGISILIGYWFTGRQIMSLIVGIAMIVGGLFVSNLPQNVWFLPLGSPPSLFMLDYYPLIPWFGAILIGIAIGERFYGDDRRRFRLPRAKIIQQMQYTAKPLSWAGKHALTIYVIHQPLLLAFLWIVGVISW